VTLMYALAALLALFVFGYLLFVLVRAEQF
jgi:hypothetical protein